MLVCRRKYEAVVGDEKIARERFVKWKARCAVIGCPEVRGIDIMWSTFAPTIGMTAGRAVISLVFNHVFDVRFYDLGGVCIFFTFDALIHEGLPETQIFLCLNCKISVDRLSMRSRPDLFKPEVALMSRIIFSKFFPPREAASRTPADRARFPNTLPPNHRIEGRRHD